MTLADLQRKAAALDALRADWARAILPAVGRTLDDARAHAERALTQALKAAADGRPTARRAARSPSFRAALHRLDELLEWLAGPSDVSLEGRVRDARERFYREAFRLNKPLVPDVLHVSADPQPTQQNLRLVRGALIHGLDLRRELSGPFDQAKRALAAAVAQAGQRSTPGHAEADLLDAWRRRSGDAIAAAVLRCLSDSLEFADTESARDLIHPDYFEEPAAAGG